MAGNTQKSAGGWKPITAPVPGKPSPPKSKQQPKES